MAGYAINPGAHIDAPLSNYLSMYRFSNGIADIVSPVVPVKRRSDRYYQWDKASLLRAGDDSRRARATKPRIIEPTESDSSYLALEYELATFIEDGDYANTDSALRLEQAKTLFVADTIRAQRELRVALQYAATTDGGLVPAGSVNTLSGTNQWSDAGFTAANLERDVFVGREAVRAATGQDANYIIIPKAVAKTVALNSDIKTMLSYKMGDQWLTQGAVLGGGAPTGNDGIGARPYLPATLFGLQVLEPGMISNTAKEGAAASFSDVWGKHVRILYVNPALPMMDIPSAGYTFRSTEYGTSGWNVRRWREEGPRVNYFGVGIIDAEVLTASDMIYVLRNAIA